MTILRSVALFVVAAIAEIGGAYLVWQGVREKRGLLLTLAGILALGAYGLSPRSNLALTSDGSSPPTRRVRRRFAHLGVVT